MMRYFACLSTIPSRIEGISATIQSLLTQSHPPQKIYLFLSKEYRRFPNVQIQLPKWLEDNSIDRLQIHWTQDIGPATKVWPVSEIDEIEMDDYVLYVDDDRVYAPDLAKAYLDEHQKHPSETRLAVGSSGNVWSTGYTSLGKPTQWKWLKQSGYVDMIEGCNGVMVRKRYIHPGLLTLLTDECRYVDDECLSAIYAVQKVDCYALARKDNWRTTFDELDALCNLKGSSSRISQSNEAKKRARELWNIWLETEAGIERCKTGYGDLFIWCNDAYIIESLRAGRVFEEDLVLNYLKTLIDKARVIVDVGAHIGCHTLLYHRLSQAKIHSFEAQKQVYSCLKRNIEWNELSRVIPYHCALGHRIGIARMATKPTDGPNTDSSISYGSSAPDFNLGGMQLGSGGEELRMITLDSLEFKEIDYMKIDVEGFEPLVLLGGLETIKRCHPVIMFEYNHKRITQEMIDYFSLTEEQARASCFDILRSIGYRISTIPGDNYLAVHPESFIAQRVD